MIKYHEPELVSTSAMLTEEDQAPVPALQAGDQVACIDSGAGPTLATTLVDEEYYTIDWFTLLNTPALTRQVWGNPVPGGSVALQLGDHDWRVLVCPRVMARRRVS